MRERMRPWAWVAVGSLTLVFGSWVTSESLQDLAGPTDVLKVPRCQQDFDAECVTEREARVLQRSFSGRGWIVGEKSWVLTLATPGPDDRDRIGVDLLRQPGRGLMSPGRGVDVLFLGEKPALLLVDDHQLRTEDHPAIAGPDKAAMGVLAIFGSLMGLHLGLVARRRAGSWRRATQPAPNAWLLAATLAGLAHWLTLRSLGGGRIEALAAPALVVVAAAWMTYRYRKTPRDKRERA